MAGAVLVADVWRTGWVPGAGPARGGPARPSRRQRQRPGHAGKCLLHRPELLVWVRVFRDAAVQGGQAVPSADGPPLVPQPARPVNAKRRFPFTLRLDAGRPSVLRARETRPSAGRRTGSPRLTRWRRSPAAPACRRARCCRRSATSSGRRTARRGRTSAGTRGPGRRAGVARAGAPGRKRGMSCSSMSTRTCSWLDVAQHDQRLARRGADELAGPDVHLQHLAVDRRPRPTSRSSSVSRLLDLGLGLRDRRPGDGLVRLPRPGLEQVRSASARASCCLGHRAPPARGGSAPPRRRRRRPTAAAARSQLVLLVGQVRPRPRAPAPRRPAAPPAAACSSSLRQLRLGRRQVRLARPPARPAAAGRRAGTAARRP